MSPTIRRTVSWAHDFSGAADAHPILAFPQVAVKGLGECCARIAARGYYRTLSEEKRMLRSQLAPKLMLSHPRRAMPEKAPLLFVIL